MRIARVLEQHQQIGISNLAMLARMNHQRCSSTVRWMEREGYLTISFRKGKKTIILTEKGIQQIKKLSFVSFPT